MNDPRWNRPPAVIITALELQYEAVRDRLAGPAESYQVGGARFALCSLADGPGTVALAAVEEGAHGAAVLARHAIHAFSPVAVLFVGVAGALKPGLRLGDVVFATHLYAHHGTAVRAGGPVPWPRMWQTDRAVGRVAREVARRRAATVRAARPVVHFGAVASGAIVPGLPAAEPSRWIRENCADALAVEMEATGVAEARQLSAAPIGVVRGISDRADGTATGPDTADRQAPASGNAAVFAVDLATELLAQRGILQEAGPPAPKTASGVLVGGPLPGSSPLHEGRSWW